MTYCVHKLRQIKPFYISFKYGKLGWPKFMSHGLDVYFIAQVSTLFYMQVSKNTMIKKKNDKALQEGRI